MFCKQLILAHTLFAIAYAANDWSVPCTNQKCSYDAGDGVNAAWSQISLQASKGALSDITQAAGWQISGCKSDWRSGVAQVTITCDGTDVQKTQCSNLFEDGGAVNKVVRLPQDCGVGPFARVKSIAGLERRAGGPEQHLVALDYDFGSVTDASKQLSFTLGASNVKGGASPPRFRKSQTRSYPLPFERRFDKSKDIDVPPVSIHKSFPLFDKSIDCPAPESGGVGFKGGVGLDVQLDLDAQPKFGVSVSGSVFPLPKLTSMKITGSVTGSAGAVFDLKADLTGKFDTGKIPIFSVGLPGLDFPGIFELGPEFSVNTQLVAELGLQADIKAGATFQFPKVDLVFPPSEGQSAADATPVPNAFKMSLEPTAKADGSVEAHLTPRVELGLKVLGGVAQATVFLDLDGNAKLGLQADGSLGNLAPGGDKTKTANGCASLDAGFAITAGGIGKIEPIFDKDVNFDILRKDVNLFKKCFGTPGAKSEAFARSVRQSRQRSLPRNIISSRDLGCGGVPGLGDLAEALNL